MNIIIILINIMLIVIPLIVLIGMYKTQWRMVKEQSREKSKNVVLSMLKDKNAYEVDKYKTNRNYFSVGHLDDYLSSRGAYYMFKWLDPAMFLIVKTVVAILFLVLGFMLCHSVLYLTFTYSIIIGLFFAVGGFYLFDLLINISDESDNEKMLNDIHTIFNILRIQTRAGVFLSESLSECYLSVKNDRLKTAFLEMTNKIAITNDLEESIDDFNRKFNNRYIDTLCITLKQARVSGKSLKLLEDLSKQIEDIQLASNIREREKMETKVQFFELIVFVDLLAIVLYALAIEMVNTFQAF